MRTLDIFCGGGGSSFGAMAAGADIVCGIDMWRTATDTFKENFPNSIAKTAKLENIKPNKLRDKIGDIDLLLSSPECTNHTCAKGSAPRSEESRATALQTIRFAKAFQPRWVVMENVVHMRPWSRYEEMKDELRQLGYNISELILDASDFSVAQKRRRLFVICDREEAPPTKLSRRGHKRKSAISILDAPGVWQSSPLFQSKRASATLERANRGLKAVGKKTPFLLVYYGSDGSGGWQSLDNPLRTVTTVDRFALVEPSRKGHSMRMLQVPELKRAMGFPESYKLNKGTRREKIHILGNGVCPPVMRQIIRTISEN